MLQKMFGRGLAGSAVFSVTVLFGAATVQAAYNDPFDFDGMTDFQIDTYGYYYMITGGKFPTGPTPNGDNASGGTFRYLTDSTDWGSYPVDTWNKDDWFPQNASFALTLRNNGAITYDNNGIEDGSYGDYYATQAGKTSAETPGLYRGYSMTNVWDWVYAGYFLIEQTMVVDEIIGYFDENSGFDRNNPDIAYAMNIWSNVENDLLPTNTGNFKGDVFHRNSQDDPAGFSTSDTGVDRVFGADYSNATDDIFRLTLALEQELILEPGVYWFNHAAFVRQVPEPGTLALLAGGLGLLVFARRRRTRTSP